jgi:serine/threonine protein kinase/rRNA-processing protein FCF1
VVGEGGMGVVLAAHQLSLDTPVAIKMMLAKFLADPELRARFEREARAAARLDSERVVRVKDIDHTHDGTPFIVMELLQGESVDALLERRGALPVWQAVELVLHACEGLAAAHAVGIIHRDIKPSNLFLAERADGLPWLKVLDFGISKMGTAELPDGNPALTQPHRTMGSANYMAPEQLDSADRADARTDVWALGVVLLELLTGRAVERPCLFQPPLLRSVRADAPEQLERLIAACLTPDPSRRPENVLVMARELAPHGPASADASVHRIAHILGLAEPMVTSELPVPGKSPTPSAPPSPQRSEPTEPSLDAVHSREDKAATDPRPHERRRVDERAKQPGQVLSTFDRLLREHAVWPPEGEDDQPLVDALVSQTKLFVDETFLLRTAGQTFLAKRLLPALVRSASAKLILPRRVYEPLRKRARAGGEDASMAARALSVLSEFALQKRLDPRGDPNEVAGEGAGTRDLLARIVYQYQLQYELTFFTCDEGHARLLIAANQTQAVRAAKPVRVFGIDNERGLLLPWARDYEPPRFDGRYPSRIDVARLPAGARIFIDTSTFMLPVGLSFVRERLLPVLGVDDRRLLIPDRVLFELEKGARTAGEAESRTAAREARDLLLQLAQRGVADVRREEHEVAGSHNFADPLFIRLFVQHQKSAPLVLITQDRGLATQVLENARLLEAGARAPTVGFVSEGHLIARGELGNWPARLAGFRRDDGRSARPGVNPRSRAPEAPAVQPFELAQTIYAETKAKLRVTAVPTAGDFVQAVRAGRVQLTKELAEGGEGTIFETSIPDVVCKVYFEDRITEDRKRKLERMVTRPAPAPTVCWPLERVYNDHVEFVGYLMPRAQGIVLNDVVFMPRVLPETFPRWGRVELVQLAIATLTLIKKLHDLNVIIGDINQNNFMVTEQCEVYLVDTDSCQIEEFPCPVGTVLFTPPELIGCTYANVLRTKEQEMFAVATLLFMILQLGKPPYSSQDGGDLAEAIKRQRFPYKKVVGGVSSKPFGTYKFIWSNFSKALKDDFCEIFADGRRVPEPDTSGGRYPRPHGSYLERFLHDLRDYAGSIHRGRSTNELMPTKLWLSSKQEIVEIPCERAGCTKTSTLVRSWYDEMLAKGQQSFCAVHDEVRRLRKVEPRDPARRRAAAPRATSSPPRMRPSAPRWQPSQSQYAAPRVHVAASARPPPARSYSSASPRPSSSRPARFVPPPVQATPTPSLLPGWVIPLAVFIVVLAFQLSMGR